MIRDSDHLVGEVVSVMLVFILLYRSLARARQIPASPNPWDQEIEKALYEPDAVEVCHRCFDPVTPGSWFCEHCGCAVGPYNNLMPYLNVFSEGEVLRNGLSDKLPRNALVVIGYLVVSSNLYLVFAPIYWILLFRNLKRQKESFELTETGRG